MAAVHTPYNLLAYRLTEVDGTCHWKGTWKTLGHTVCLLTSSLSGGECEYQKQPEVPGEETLLRSSLLPLRDGG